MAVTIVGNNTPTAGGVVYGDGTNYASTAAGTSGQVLQSNGAGAPTWATLSSGLTLGTPVATTSGTSITFTGIPSGIKFFIVTFNTVRTNGISGKQIQLGSSGTVETSGYFSGSSRINGATSATLGGTSGIAILSDSAPDMLNGSVIFTLENATTNTWVCSGTLGEASGTTYNVGGRKSLSAVLDRIRITSVNGTDTFNLGEVNIAYM